MSLRLGNLSEWSAVGLGGPDRTRLELSLLKQVYLVLPDVFLAKAIGLLAKITSEAFNDT
jgi:hypothetical protein